MYYFKACPRCNGDVEIVQEEFGPWGRCVQCGWDKDASGYLPPVKVKVEDGRYRDMQANGDSNYTPSPTNEHVDSFEVTIAYCIREQTYSSTDVWVLPDEIQFHKFKVIGNPFRKGVGRFRVQYVVPLDPIPPIQGTRGKGPLHKALQRAIRQHLPELQVAQWNADLIDLEPVNAA